MKCPCCATELTSKVVSGIELMACDGGCGGIWLHHHEFKKFEDPQQPDIETLLHLKIDPAARRDQDPQRKCPKCLTFIMMKHFADVRHKVKIDECPKCAGIWLDAGELHEIHGQYGTEAERVQAANQLFDDMFASKLEAIHEHDAEVDHKIEKFAHALRFICPSYYK